MLSDPQACLCAFAELALLSELSVTSGALYKCTQISESICFGSAVDLTVIFTGMISFRLSSTTT